MNAQQLEAFFKAQPQQAGYHRDAADVGVEFTYGELTLDGVDQLLRDAETRSSRPVRNFVDLGSGTGKLCIAAAAMFPKLERSIGVELSRNRHDIGVKNLAALRQQEPKRRESLDHVRLIHDDVRKAVAAVAAADVIWISNTCFPEALNKAIAEAIDEFASEGAFVYATRSIGLTRVASKEASAVVHVGCTWAENHSVGAYQMVGPAPAFENCDGDAGSFAERAFAYWTSPAAHEDDGKHTAAVQQEDLHHRTLEGEFLRAAVADALLPRVAVEHLVDGLYVPDGALNELCEDALSTYPEGLDLEAFDELCDHCYDADHGVEAKHSHGLFGGMFSMCRGH